MYNVIIIKKNGLTVTGQAETYLEAMQELAHFKTSEFYKVGSGARFFIADQDGRYGISEYTAQEVMDESVVKK